MSKFKQNAESLSEKINELVNLYRNLYPEVSEVHLHVVTEPNSRFHRWGAYKAQGWDVFGKENPGRGDNNPWPLTTDRGAGND